MLTLSDFYFTVKYRAWLKNQMADSLSRCITELKRPHQDGDDLPCFRYERVLMTTASSTNTVVVKENGSEVIDEEDSLDEAHVELEF